MPARRIVAGACALALALPAAAVARPALGPFIHSHGHGATSAAPGIMYGSSVYVARKPASVSGVMYGSTAYVLQNQRYAAAHQPAAGALGDAQVAAAYRASRPGATPAAASSHGGSDDNWRVAAIIEAGLLAAFVLGGTAVVLMRRRSPVRV